MKIGGGGGRERGFPLVMVNEERKRVLDCLLLYFLTLFGILV